MCIHFDSYGGSLLRLKKQRIGRHRIWRCVVTVMNSQPTRPTENQTISKKGSRKVNTKPGKM